MNTRILTEEHIVSCAEYAEHWMSQAAMWIECNRPALAKEAMRQAARVSDSAFRWAVQREAEAQMVRDFRELTRA